MCRNCFKQVKRIIYSIPYFYEGGKTGIAIPKTGKKQKKVVLVAHGMIFKNGG